MSLPIRRVFASLVALVVVVSFTACSDDSPLVGPLGAVDEDEGVPGSGDVITESRAVDGFDRILFAGEGDVVVVFGDVESLTVETDDNLLRYIETTVTAGRLEIRTEDGIDIAPTQSVSYVIGANSLTEVVLAGAGSIAIDAWSVEDAAVALPGVGEIRVADLTATTLEARLAGVGGITVGGAVDTQDVVAAGVGEFDGGDLRSRAATVEASGGGVATVWVTDRLDITASQTGNVSYYGSPQVTQEVDATATVASLGDK